MSVFFQALNKDGTETSPDQHLWCSPAPWKAIAIANAGDIPLNNDFGTPMGTQDAKSFLEGILRAQEATPRSADYYGYIESLREIAEWAVAHEGAVTWVG